MEGWAYSAREGGLTLSMSTSSRATTSTVAPSSSSWAAGPGGRTAPPGGCAVRRSPRSRTASVSSVPSTTMPPTPSVKDGLGDDPDLVVELHRLGAGGAQLLDRVEQRVDRRRCPSVSVTVTADARTADRHLAGQDLEAVGRLLGLRQRRLRAGRCRLSRSRRVVSSRAESRSAPAGRPRRGR